MRSMLKMDKPDTRNRLDDMKQGVIGKPVDRLEGPLKVSGRATYAAEEQPDDCLEGVLVTATIPLGSVKRIDKQAALAMDGVIAVIDDPRLIARPAQGTAGEAPVQGTTEVGYVGQPIAAVIAETFEQARDAAEALTVEYDSDDGDAAAFDPAAAEGERSESVSQGDLAHAMNEAPRAVDVTVSTEGHASAAMEPHAALAQWDGEQLTVRASLQMLNYNIAELADALDLEEEAVRLLAPYVGGGFGSKLGVSPEVVAASLAAMKLERPVRVVLSRRQVFQCISRRSETAQRLRLAADEEGRLTGFGHEARVSQLPGEEFSEPVTQASEFLYAGENRLLATTVARVHRTTAGSVRAPGEAVGMQALEVAMDELAEELGLDPVELRLRNIPDKHPSEGLPYSSRKLAEALKQGAEAFGWDAGPRTPRQQLEGDQWIGTGMATAARIHNVSEAKASVSLSADGTARVTTDMTDIGTGTYTILQQIAAEMLGIAPEKVAVELGDTQFPPGPGSGGSWGAASTGSAVFLACEAIRKAIAGRLNTDEEKLDLKDGHASWDGETRALTDILEGGGLTEIGHFEPGEADEDFAAASYGAFFSEVSVDRWTGEVRVRRMLGAFGIGRVLNAKTARSQCLGGMTWCIGSALTEALLFDPTDGHLVNCDLAEYHVPVHRDVPDLEVLFVEERDPAASLLQAKGVGELGVCGGAGAIANAVYNACGARVREFPMTPDRVLAAMEREGLD